MKIDTGLLKSVIICDFHVRMFSIYEFKTIKCINRNSSILTTFCTYPSKLFGLAHNSELRSGARTDSKVRPTKV